MTPKLKKTIIRLMNKNGFALTGILIAIIIALAGVVIYVSLSKNQETSPPEAISPPPATSPLTKEIPLSQVPTGWKTYKSLNGYEVSYPSNLAVWPEAYKQNAAPGEPLLVPVEVAVKAGQTCIGDYSGAPGPCGQGRSYISFERKASAPRPAVGSPADLPCDLSINQLGISLAGGTCYEIGAEGDKEATYTFPIISDVLVVKWGHIGKQYLPSRFNEQQTLFKSVMTTLKIQ